MRTTLRRRRSGIGQFAFCRLRAFDAKTQAGEGTQGFSRRPAGAGTSDKPGNKPGNRPGNRPRIGGPAAHRDPSGYRPAPGMAAADRRGSPRARVCSAIGPRCAWGSRRRVGRHEHAGRASVLPPNVAVGRAAAAGRSAPSGSAMWRVGPWRSRASKRGDDVLVGEQVVQLAADAVAVGSAKVEAVVAVPVVALDGASVRLDDEHDLGEQLLQCCVGVGEAGADQVGKVGAGGRAAPTSSSSSGVSPDTTSRRSSLPSGSAVRSNLDQQHIAAEGPGESRASQVQSDPGGQVHRHRSSRHDQVRAGQGGWLRDEL